MTYPNEPSAADMASIGNDELIKQLQSRIASLEVAEQKWISIEDRASEIPKDKDFLVHFAFIPPPPLSQKDSKTDTDGLH